MQSGEVDKDALEQIWQLSENYQKSYEPDLEAGLNKLKGRIKKDQRPTTPVRQLQWLRRAAAVIALLIAFGFALNRYVNRSAVVNITTTEALVENYALPDGTLIWVNKHSNLSFPKDFSEKERVVHLEGEAFFQIAKNPNQPFVVKTADSEVRVLGTAFNLRAYSNEKEVSIEVKEGRVEFNSLATEEKRNLKAGDKVSFEKEKELFSNVSAIAWKDVAWKNKKLNFTDTPIKEVAAYLKTNFGVSVVIKPKNLENCLFNASFVDNTPESILKQLQLAFSDINMKKTHSNTYQLSGNCR